MAEKLEAKWNVLKKESTKDEGKETKNEQLSGQKRIKRKIDVRQEKMRNEWQCKDALYK